MPDLGKGKQRLGLANGVSGSKREVSVITWWYELPCGALCFFPSLKRGPRTLPLEGVP